MTPAKKGKGFFMKILNVKRERNSIYGNPAWEIVAIMEDGTFLMGKTASNSLLGYEVLTSWIGNNIDLAFHKTKTGRIIFDRLLKKES